MEIKYRKLELLVALIVERRLVQTIGTLSNDDGNAKENVIEITVFGSFILLRDYSNSFNLSDVAELSGN